MNFPFFKKHPIGGWITLLFIVSLIWGTTFILVKEILTEMSPASYIFSRFSLASCILFLVYWKDVTKFWTLFSKKGVFLGLLLSVVYFSGSYGVEYTSASNATFISSLFIIFVPFMEWIINKKKIPRRFLIATVLAIVGILFLTGVISLSFNVGDGLILVGAVAMSFHIFYTDEFIRDTPTKSLMVSQLLVVTIVAGIVGLLQGDLSYPTTTETFYPILYLAIFASVFAFEVISHAGKYVESTDVSLILSFQGIFAFILSVLLVLEVPTPYKIIGVILLTFANILAESKKKSLPH